MALRRHSAPMPARKACMVLRARSISSASCRSRSPLRCHTGFFNSLIARRRAWQTPSAAGPKFCRSTKACCDDPEPLSPLPAFLVSRMSSMLFFCSPNVRTADCTDGLGSCCLAAQDFFLCFFVFFPVVCQPSSYFCSLVPSSFVMSCMLSSSSNGTTTSVLSSSLSIW